MNPDLLERVLRCRDLPTLPAVAMRVVELTGNDAVRVKDLADAIQNDQALAAKVLRTVNSSLYAMRTRCSSINQAIVMLGMSAVKSLALSFSLVGAIRECQAGDFDMDDYWRRGIYTAIAARAIAVKARMRTDPTPEECFLGGLLQDLGMLALYFTLGRPYLEVIQAAEGDHRKVARLELKVLELHHADVGAMIAKRWKLPEALVMPIKYHERPTAAPLEYTAVVRAVGLGNLAADVLMATEPAAPLRRFYDRAKQWFNFDGPQADEVLRTMIDSAAEVRSLLSVPPSELPDSAALLARARAQMQTLSVHAGEHGSQASPAGDALSVDDLTGIASRLQFDRSLVAAFEQTRRGSGPLSIALFDVDGLDRMNNRYGREAGDTILIGIAGRLERAVEAMGGLVARYDEGRFATIMPRADRATALGTTEAAREAVAREPFRLVAAKSGAPPTVSASVSVGVACADEEMLQRFENPGELMNIVEQSLAAAKKAGPSAARSCTPAAA
jgi:two-component system cell cycle response regulator